MFINIETKEQLTYNRLKILLPNILLPSKPLDSQLLPLGYANLYYTTRPEYNGLSEMLTENTPQLIDDKWTITYSIVPNPNFNLDDAKADFKRRAKDTFVEWCKANSDNYVIESIRKGIPIPEDIVALVVNKENLYTSYKTSVNNCIDADALLELDYFRL